VRPTGSGKTTTLHSILKFLNTPDTKIWTAETSLVLKDCARFRSTKAELTLRWSCARFAGRPDIIMVGESRDKETVSMGVEASLTGHMVFSTLHYIPPESITRLLLGMDPFNFADALLGILAALAKSFATAKTLPRCRGAQKLYGRIC
jgi:type II secretory ATPase GspE/PulE/Tfp pilus assembly ATPase PilB-like protein